MTSIPGRVWVRDGALGGLGANVAGVLALLGAVAALDGPGQVARALALPVFWQMTLPLVAAGAALGALAGALARAAFGAAGDRWWLLLPLGFPTGAIAGFAEIVFARAVGMQGDPPLTSGVLAVACGGGAAVLGLGWPLYLVLRVGERPGWAALVLTPVVAVFAAVAPLAVVIWWELPA